MLKLSNSAGESAHHGLGSGQEVWFSRHVAPGPEMARVPLVRCYAAAHAPPHGASHALVEDLSETHWQPPYPLPPPDALCGEAVEALAALHGAWWGHARLGPGGDITRRLAWVRGAAGGVGLGRPLEGVAREFLDFLGDRLASQRRRLLQRLLAALPSLRQRRLDGPQTLLHGDAHWWNYLYPNDPARETTRLLDWGSWRVGAPADDLAYALALQWYPERRRRLEEPLLRRYHDALLRAGVGGYGWDDLRADYRLSVATGPLTPARFWALGVPPYIWWPMLECASLAFEDLGCAALLEI
jgi:Phosphotransferase enzyme family